MTQGKPPPPPPPLPASVPPAVPKGTKDRMALAKAAMRLRDEQLRARIVYVDPTLETNAELDAITAKVVEELKKLQKAGMKAKMPNDAQGVEIELIRALRELLEKMVSARREHFLRHKIETIQRKIANLYFTSEIYTDAKEVFDVEFTYPDEALLAVVQRYSGRMLEDLMEFKDRDVSVQKLAMERLSRYKKQLAGDVLAHSRPELERLLVVYRDVLLVFLMKDFRDALGDFCWEVVQQSQIARGHELSYKILEGQFASFRQTFETKFMDRLLIGLSAPLQRRLREEPDYDFKEDTLRFAADPRIYAEICAVMCNTIYGYLHGEGFLDLPVTWQRQIYGE